MTNQIKPSVTNPTIADIFQKISEKRLDLAPSFQRRFVWTQEHQEQFIDTILQGYPFPEIYVCQGETDIKRIITKQKVIDGQQRLTTIMNYINDSFEKPLKLIKKFDDLESEERRKFLEYQIVVRDIGQVEDAVVKEIFRRINLTKFKLDDIEIHNAIYDGQFIQTAKSLSNEINLNKYEVFHDSEITRMVDIHFFLTVLSTLERGGYFARDSEIEKCVEEFNESFINSHLRKSEILRAFSILDNLQLPLDSIWFRKSNFFTLIVEFSKNKIDNLSVIKEKLLNFEKLVLNNRNDPSNIYGEYYRYMYSGTNDRKARVRRSEILINDVLS
ncbi:hypothetical protein GCM10023345_28090 [Acinetobacter kookii]|uniref:GmrSD restriction endonucleases N-terminal domain-containing protein n=1 Tax=Acinetobacter kookii TaxID=1226327 RepID=A0A1G6NEL6_9GAMM|nr:DUF262 domain-containing protein [Acinetobacter kookii]SDC65864.1 Protein of unknown function DUF262 [Acinetobacter kookii]